MSLKALFKLVSVLFLGALAGCTVSNSNSTSVVKSRVIQLEQVGNYAMIKDGGYTIPAIPHHKIAQHYRRQLVSYPTREVPGTIVVDTQDKYLYFVMEKGKAMRYGIGVGRDGFRWAGATTVGLKREWPSWTPPAPMMRRQPHLVKYAGGMKGGLSNPLGARALYLYRNGRDTLYRLHGTPEWWTIGTNASSGCIRLMNHDIIDLYNRAKVGAKVVSY